MFPNLTTDEVMELAAKVGRRVAREYPGIEADDITSAALTDLAEKASRLKSDDEPYIYKVLYTDGIRYAAKERYNYLIGTSHYLYQPREVRALLAEAYWDPTMWDVPSAKDERLSASISGATVGVSLMDLQEAWEGLKFTQANVLTRRFRDEEDVKDTKAVSRAIDALTRRMNSRVNRPSTEDDGPGTRRALGNAEAQFITRNEGDQQTFRKDAVDDYQGIRAGEPSKPAGTHYDWSKAVA